MLILQNNMVHEPKDRALGFCLIAETLDTATI
jgi:hypothetical protein